MGEPSENPRQNKNEELSMLVGGINFYKVWIFFSHDFIDNFTHCHPYLTKFKGKEIIEVSSACSLHQIISRAVPEENEKDRGHIMESLNVL